MGGPVGVAGPHLGRVASFDPTRGLGTVVDDDGSSYDFHATAIADGSRRIDAGTRWPSTSSPATVATIEARRILTCRPLRAIGACVQGTGGARRAGRPPEPTPDRDG